MGLEEFGATLVPFLLILWALGEEAVHAHVRPPPPAAAPVDLEPQGPTPTQPAVGLLLLELEGG